MSSTPERPPRPAIPPSLYALACVAAGAMLAGLPEAPLPLAAPLVVLAVLGIAFVVCQKLEVNRVPAIAWLVCAALAMGCVAETTLLVADDAAAEALASHPVSSCTFVVASP